MISNFFLSANKKKYAIFIQILYIELFTNIMNNNEEEIKHPLVISNLNFSIKVNQNLNISSIVVIDDHKLVRHNTINLIKSCLSIS